MNEMEQQPEEVVEVVEYENENEDEGDEGDDVDELLGFGDIDTNDKISKLLGDKDTNNEYLPNIDTEAKIKEMLGL